MFVSLLVTRSAYEASLIPSLKGRKDEKIREGVKGRKQGGDRKRENHKESFLCHRFSATEQTERDFLLRATSPLRVTGRLANHCQHKTPSRPRGGGGRCQT